MIWPVPSSITRSFLVLFSVILAAALAYPAIRNARAVREAGRGTRTGYENSIRLEPSNPLNRYLLGRYWQYSLEESDPNRAIQAYRSSLALDPRAADVWLDLAISCESEGDIPAARDAFHHALAVYPLSAEVHWRYGNFLLRQGELPQAFAQIHQTVSIDPKRAAEAFSRVWRVDPDIQLILDKALPAQPAVYLDAIRQLDAGEETSAALVVWARLVALRPVLAFSDAFSLVDALLQAHRSGEARRVWNEAVTLSGITPPADPPGSVLWDGGFETGIRDAGFAWRFPVAANGVQSTIDTSAKHSGNSSLRLGFDGQHNVNFSDLCHVAAVQPSTAYRFSAWVQTEALTSDQGVRFRIFWQENSREVSLDSPDVHGSHLWTRIEMPWVAADVRQVRVCVSRNPSADFSTRIQGAAWIDDVALVPETPEKPAP